MLQVLTPVREIAMSVKTVSKIIRSATKTRFHVWIIALSVLTNMRRLVVSKGKSAPKPATTVTSLASIVWTGQRSRKTRISDSLSLCLFLTRVPAWSLTSHMISALYQRRLPHLILILCGPTHRPCQSTCTSTISASRTQSLHGATSAQELSLH